MADAKSIHWTRDEARLERYVMGRVESVELSVLEKHLAVCTECREAVRAEKQIVAGIRRVGMDELKNRLAQRIGKGPSHTMANWYRVLGIAAAIVLLVTIGIYNEWFFSGKVQHSVSTSKADSSLPKPDQSFPKVGEGKKGPGPIQHVDGAKSREGERNYAPKGVREETAKGAEIEQRRALQIERGNPANVDVTHAVRPDNRLMKDGELASFAAQAPQEIWAGGTVIAVESENQVLGKALMKSAEDRPDNLKREKASAKSLLQEKRDLGVGADITAVNVIQRKLSDVPQQQRGAREGSVQMLFRKDAKGLQVTLFMDSVLSPIDLGSARLQRIRSDSTILVIGKKRIAFRLPSGWTQLLKADDAKHN